MYEKEEMLHKHFRVVLGEFEEQRKRIAELEKRVKKHNWEISVLCCLVVVVGVWGLF